MKLNKIFLLALIAIGYKANGESFGREQDTLFMKTIQLKTGQKALVDDQDYEWLNQWTWNIINGKYVYRTLDSVTMHRLIMGLVKGDGKICDHADRNTLNNQRSNLRIASASQNMANRKPYGLSKYIGVSLRRNIKNGVSHPTWTVNIRINNKRKYVGTFPLNPEGEIQAAKAYDKAAKEAHGEFANLNFPVESALSENKAK